VTWTPVMSEVTVESFVQTLAHPLTPAQVFEWPPDLFATTSAILRITGAYRHVVSPPEGQQWPPELHGRWADDDWTRATSAVAGEWLDAIADAEPLNLPEWMAELKSHLESTWSQTTIEQLREIEFHGHAWPLCRTVLSLHAIADSACVGFGTPVAPRRHPLVSFLADHLLSTYGSLSRLPKSKGIVLPKMRTPQSGLTLRATSLYVTWHQTEVEAVWRSTPWVNAEENTLNVMILPWPTDVQPNAFRRNDHPLGKRSLGPNRYFTYEPSTPLDVDRVVDLIRDSTPLASRIHLLVLPEMAMSHADLRALQLKLAEQLTPDRIPLIIAGLRNWETASSDRRRSSEPGCNSVVLSMYFADKWYDLRQNKHHRWKLDRRQVQQYTIGGVLASDRSWWEDVPIPPRKLSILAPTGWLALCPLICEDLAQLEPVSELIRGIGPTLLVALLLDGPQLPSRWSARYASVMADDPGTSVLTVTSVGMASRARPLNMTSEAVGRLGGKPDKATTVALWRDAATGFRELVLNPEDDGLIVTLSANWHEEISADGRSDGGAAATFILGGVQPVRAVATPPNVGGATTRTKVMQGDQEDLYELTTFAQLVDAALDAPAATITSILNVARDESDSVSSGLPTEVQAVVALIRVAETRWRTTRVSEREFAAAVDYFEEFVTHLLPPVTPKDPSRTSRNTSDVIRHIQRWEHIVLFAEERIAALDASPDTVRRRRTTLAVLHNVLWAVHNRLEHMRRCGDLTRQGAALGGRIQVLLSRKWTFEPTDDSGS
jgi:hypothetical protein